jgi:hypothetical protein
MATHFHSTLADFNSSLGNARRALLVPPGSGVFGETLASVRALTLGALTGMHAKKAL